MISNKYAVAACAGLSFAATIFADDPVSTPAPRTRASGTLIQTGVPATDGSAAAGIVTPAQNDQHILQWVRIDCEALRECAKAAASKSTREDVKALAATVLADHDKWGAMIKDKHGAAAVSAYVPAGQATGTLVKDDGASRDGRLAYAPTDFVAVKRKVCDRMKAVAERSMKELTGAEYDRAFLKAAVFGHEAALAGIAEVRGGASTELAETLDRLKEGLAGHLKAAEELCKTERASR